MRARTLVPPNSERVFDNPREPVVLVDVLHRLDLAPGVLQRLQRLGQLLISLFLCFPAVPPVPHRWSPPYWVSVARRSSAICVSAVIALVPIMAVSCRSALRCRSTSSAFSLFSSALSVARCAKPGTSSPITSKTTTTPSAPKLIRYSVMEADNPHPIRPGGGVIGGLPGGVGDPAGACWRFGRAGAPALAPAGGGGLSPPFVLPCCWAMLNAALTPPWSAPRPAAASGGMPGGGLPASCSARWDAVDTRAWCTWSTSSWRMVAMR